MYLKKKKYIISVFYRFYFRRFRHQLLRTHTTDSDGNVHFAILSLSVKRFNVNMNHCRYVYIFSRNINCINYIKWRFIRFTININYSYSIVISRYLLYCEDMRLSHNCIDNNAAKFWCTKLYNYSIRNNFNCRNIQ